MAQERKRKLLVFTSTFPRWKEDTDPPFVFELAKRLVDSFDVFVLTPSYPGAQKKESVEGITVLRFSYFFPPFQKLAGGTGILPTVKKNPFYYTVIPFFLFFGLVALLWQSIKIRPDIIHAHWLIPQGFLAGISKRFTGVPTVITVHGADAFAFESWAGRRVKTIAIRCADSLTYVSNAIARQLATLGDHQKNVAVLPMGVDGELFYNPSLTSYNQTKKSDHSVKLLYVGRLTEKKGVSYLIEACEKLLAEKVNFSLTIVGHGELETALKERVDFLNLKSEITFLGGITNNRLPEIYKQHDVFIGPSVRTASGDREGFGLTFVEAAMAGCFIIGTEVGGVRDIIEDGKTGLLVPEKNAEKICDAIRWFKDNPEKAFLIRKECQKRCMEKFHWSIIARQYKELFNTLL